VAKTYPDSVCALWKCRARGSEGEAMKSSSSVRDGKTIGGSRKVATASRRNQRQGLNEASRFQLARRQLHNWIVTEKSV